MIGIIGGFMVFALLAGGFLFLPKEAKVFVVAALLASPFYIPVIMRAFASATMSAQTLGTPEVEASGVFSDPSMVKSVLISVAIFAGVIILGQLYNRIEVRKDNKANEDIQ